MGMQSCQVLALCGMVTLPLAQLFPLTGHVPSPLALFPQAQEAVRAPCMYHVPEQHSSFLA